MLGLEIIINMSNARINAIEYALPEKIEDNQFLVTDMGLEWSADDIYQKTGIKQRHIALSNECASDIAVAAVKKLFAANVGLQEKIDYIIFCSQSVDYALPTTACLLQERLHLSKQCGAVDINQGCAGFIHALALAKGLVSAGIAANILVITAETYSKYIDRYDKTTRTIFGDGAAACWVSSEGTGWKIDDFIFGTDGFGAENLIVKNSAARYENDVNVKLFMDGPEIFQFTLKVVPRTAKELLAKHDLCIDDIDYFVFHQANAYMLEYLRKKLKISPNKYFVDLADTGNLVSASIPVALKKAVSDGRVKTGMKVMLLGFGVGYAWGGCIIEI